MYIVLAAEGSFLTGRKTVFGPFDSPDSAERWLVDNIDKAQGYDVFVRLPLQTMRWPSNK